MNILPTGTSRHVVHASAAAFTMASGVPTRFKFAYGTWSVPTTGLENRGIITSFTASPVGEQSNLKEGGGSTMAIAIIDPGWQITMSILFSYDSSGPARGSGISIYLPVAERAGDDGYVAVVTGVTAKWEREGWRMIEVTAEARDSLNLGNTHGVGLEEDSSVAVVLYTPPA
ncbi:MAG: hypothetical protein V4726_11055 [Verrucomicrobiota bacterium]